MDNTNTAQALADECKQLADDYADWMAAHASDFGYQGNKDTPDFSGCPEVLRSQKRLRVAIDRLASLASQAAEPTMSDAVAAGDGTLHGAIDYWQQRAQAAEQEPFGWAIVDKYGIERARRNRIVDGGSITTYENKAMTQAVRVQYDDAWPSGAPHRLVTLYAAPVRAAGK